MADWGRNNFLEDFFKGDQQAFNEIFKKHYAGVCHFALRLTGDMQESEDIALSSFTKLFIRHKNFATTASIETFLYVATRNACFDFLRYKNRLSASQKGYTYLNSGEADTNSTQVTEQVLDIVYRAIKELPPTRKQVFQMLYIQGLKPAAVAEKLGISVTTVKDHKTKALKALRAFLPRDLFILSIILSIGVCLPGHFRQAISPFFACLTGFF